MSTALAPKQQGGGLSTWVADPAVVGRLQASLGDVMPADQFVAHMLTAFQDPKVARCIDKSKYTAIHECAAMALLPTLDQVRLIPYVNRACPRCGETARKDSGPNGACRCQKCKVDFTPSLELNAMPQWQGYKALMERHPDILEVQGVLVHVRDEVAVENGEPRHSFDPFDPEREIKSVADIRGGYCKILYRNGRPPKYHFTTARQVAKAQQCAQTQNIWNKWYEQMALKTLYRDCYARRAVPIDPLVGARLQRTLKADDLSLGNDPGRVQPVAPRVSVDDLLGKSQPPEPGPESPEPTEQPPQSEAPTEPDQPTAGPTEPATETPAPEKLPEVDELLARIEVGDEAEVEAVRQISKNWTYTGKDKIAITKAANKRLATLKGE